MKTQTMESKQIEHPRIVSEAEWTVARKDLLNTGERIYPAA